MQHVETLDRNAATRFFWRGPLLRLAVPLALAAAEAALVVAASVAAGVAWHAARLETLGPIDDFLAIGVYVGSIYVTLGFFRRDFDVGGRWTERFGEAGHVFAAWNSAVLAMLVGFFLMKMQDDVSRGSMAVFYLVGFATVLSWRRVIAGPVARYRSGSFGGEASTLLVVAGGRNEPFVPDVSDRFAAVIQLELARDGDRTRAELEHAVRIARQLHCDRVCLALPWNEAELAASCVEAFLDLPVSIEVVVPRFVQNPGSSDFCRIGPLSTIVIARPSIGPLGAFAKRALDFVLSLLALVALSPLLAGIAIAIRLEGPGPVIFRQTRRGANGRTFTILKFRSMNVLEDGPVIVQAKKADPRVTRVGRFLRRSNLDELPQLVNVLFGDMSLVGPRPHAIAHDDAYSRLVDRYSRRHKVKPGITGWAQVNGLRGETGTVEKMQARIEHDLYYIENFSVLLDLQILALTILSPRSYRNAH